MSRLRKNLAHLIEMYRINPTVLAKATGVQQPTIHRILTGESGDPRTATLQPLADYFSVSVEYLRSGDIEQDPNLNKIMGRVGGDANVLALHREDETPADSVQIKEYRVSFSAGNGHQATYDVIEESEPATYRLSWFQKTGVKPANAKRFKVTGDSMEPFLFPGDSVLVDTGESDPTQIHDGKVYAIRYGNDLRVKRLYRRLDGTLILRSDNPAYGDEEVAPELAEEHISILGRVRDKSGAGGL